mgnify:CR=1 FL=1
MAVYSVLIDKNEIVSKLNYLNAKNILIVACGGCANESLAYDNNIPIFTNAPEKDLSQSLKEGLEIPYASKTNMEKIKDYLLEKGYIVRTELISLSQDSLCIRKEHKPFTFKSLESFSPDAILSISCLAGAYGIIKSINKSVPVICIMKSKGQLSYCYRDDNYGRYIIYEKSAIIT